MANRLKRAYLAIGRRLLGEVWYARRLGATVGEGCKIFRIVYGSEPWLISIGNRVQITDGVRLLTHGGGWLMRKSNPKYDSFGAIRINDDVYIGNAAILLPGVTVGSRVLISAGAVVTKSIPSGSVVGGNPARIICSLDDYISRNLAYDMGTAGLPPARKKSLVLANPQRWICKRELTS